MSWRLNTRILRMVIAIADNHSAAKAAAQLGISPSPLSHQVRQAEDSLRVRLFERIGRRLHLTPVAETLLQSARTIISEIDRAEHGLERFRNELRPSLKVGAGAYPAHRWLVSLLKLGRDGRELPIVDIIAAKNFPLARAVVQGELDVALVAGEQRERGIAAIPLFVDELVAILPPDHRLASRSCLEAVDLKLETYISYSRHIEDGFEDDRLFRPARKAPARFIEAHSVDAIVDWVAAGLGFSILSRWAITRPAAEGRVIAVPLTPDGLALRGGRS